MALIYAQLAEFRNMKEVPADTVDAAGDALILSYLRRATRHIDRITRRHFFPVKEERSFAVPAEFFRFRYRYFTTADLWLDNDLLVADTVKTGPSDDLTTLTEGTDYELSPLNIDPKFGVYLIGTQTWNSAILSVIDLNSRAPSIFVDGWWGYHEQYTRTAWVDTNQDIPSGDMTAIATTFTIPEAESLDDEGDTDIEVGNLLLINAEFMEVVSVVVATPNRTITVRRARNGTTATTHDEDDDISKWAIHYDIKECCLMIAKAWREHDMVVGGRQGVSEMSVGVEMDIPPDAKTILIGHQRSLIGVQYH